MSFCPEKPTCIPWDDLDAESLRFANKGVIKMEMTDKTFGVCFQKL